MPDQVGSQTQRSVLIIDHSADTRQVLRTALERRGLLIFEAERAEIGLKMTRRHHPALVVLDLETLPAGAEAVREGLDSETENSRIPLVVLGNVRRSEALLPHQSVVQKPYHYGPLIRKIEQLLAASEQVA